MTSKSRDCSGGNCGDDFDFFDSDSEDDVTPKKPRSLSPRSSPTGMEDSLHPTVGKMRLTMDTKM